MLCPHCGKENNYPAVVFCPYCGQAINKNLKVKKKKDKSIAILLACLTGIFGGHKFYLGDYLLGVLYLLFSWSLIPLFFAIGDAILYACSSENVFQEKYIYQK